ncbi:MAG: hypothetical protein WBG90_19800 [Saonia sp.]
MKNVLLLSLIALFALLPVGAQQDEQRQTIDLLRKQLVAIEEEEKKALKKQIENINSLLDNGVINVTEANRLKLKSAEARTKKIDERQAVILETIYFLENKENTQKTSKDVEIFLDPDSYFNNGEGLKLRLPQKPVPPEPSQIVPENLRVNDNSEPRSPTTLDVVFALGLNNTVRDGITWQNIEDERDYLFYSSRFIELGLALKTPLWRKNGLRIKYGLSYQLNELEPSGNRFFAEIDGQTALQEASIPLSDSRFVVHNLVVPVHLEFGPTKKKYNSKGSYYSTSNKFKIGVGGYVGLSLRARQKLTYPIIINRRWFYRAEIIDDYDVNREVYGLSGYIGIGAFSLYGKYDLNTIFENGAEDEQFVSVGIRLDL